MTRHMTRGLIVLLTACGFLGCTDDGAGNSVDYGPETPIADIQKAIYQGVAGIDTTQVKTGAAVQYTTTQYLAGGQVQTLIGATVLTVTNREPIAANEDHGEQVALTVVEHKVTFGTGSGPSQQKDTDLNREFRMVFDKQKSMSYTVQGKDAPLALSAPPELNEFEKAVVHAQASADHVSFHRLVTGSARGPAPLGVQQRPNCLGLPGCTMMFNNVAFDQVTWKSDGPEKIHFNFRVSPDVPQISGFNMSPIFPFYQGLTKSCVSLMVPIGDSHEKTLLEECQEVQDFRYGS